ncbi:MAG: hypothetical protein KZQ95_07925 [Candidatus Thiodiazotropha sp. (ex Epidulcina cf. delphinae)]|nr:hypothetical protein [Candidatus Thiodiazotropha sp. (ex Epidulcina cf. delphinae)]
MPVQKQQRSSFRHMLEKWCMDAPFTDQRMESTQSLNSLDPGIRRDDEALKKWAFPDGD